MARSSPPLHGMALRAIRSCLALAQLLTIYQLAAAEPEPSSATILTNVWDRELAAQMAALFQTLPAPAKNYPGLNQVTLDRSLRQGASYARLIREKVDGPWFAALVGTSGEARFAIQSRFEW